MTLQLGGQNLVQKGTTFEVDLRLSNLNAYSSGTERVTTPEYRVNDTVVFQAMVDTYKPQTFQYFVRIFERYTASYTHPHHRINAATKKTLTIDDQLIYTVSYTHHRNDAVTKKTLTIDDGPWRMIEEFPSRDFYNHNSREITIAVKLELSLTPSITRLASPCASLYDDTELTDFELRGVDGSIHLHKAIVASSSNKLRNMFAGAWRNSAQAVVHVQDTSKATLQHLKDYMYLGVLPNTGLQQLLLLASFYKMADLEILCAHKLTTDVKPEDAYDMILFAAEHDIFQLMIGILERVQNGTLPIIDILRKQHVLNGN